MSIASRSDPTAAGVGILLIILTAAMAIVYSLIYPTFLDGVLSPLVNGLAEFLQRSLPSIGPF